MAAVFQLVLLNMLPELARDFGNVEEDFLRRFHRAAACPTSRPAHRLDIKASGDSCATKALRGP